CDSQFNTEGDGIVALSDCDEGDLEDNGDTKSVGLIGQIV
ncbi:unnamed protein product, partial [Rotaria sp. Silwood1]